ncbi:MAG: aspartate--tRNA ligase [Elusimicrobiota bacterium]
MKIKPTTDCNSLRAKNVGEEVVLSGWVSSWRDHGGVIFIDLRDINGITQIVFGRKKGIVSSEKEKELIKTAKDLRNEYVISIKGKVIKRPPGTENKSIETGEIEVVVKEIEILNKSKELPFDLKNPESVGEETRLKYRYLEMRTGKLKENLKFKSKIYQLTRRFFAQRGFFEIETPFLTKSTPEGARDFLVPSRLNPGSFYALPQSPQLFKQLFMIGGMMKYFQIVKCLRDEDFRQDRQPEFTQLDIEMSFIDEQDIKELLEEYMKMLFKEMLDIEIKTPFKDLSWHESMKRFGNDRPDLRNPIEIKDISDIAEKCDFKVFSKAAKKGVVRGIKIKNADDVSLSVIDKLTAELKPMGAKGLAWIRHKDKGLQSQITKFFKPEELNEISKRFETEPGDILFFIADNEKIACRCLSYLRNKFYEPEPNRFEFLWIVDCPLFEKDNETGQLNALHHPFTSPAREDIKLIDTEPEKVRSRAYDMVLNGSEIGGGSIRIHSIEIQNKIFEILNISKKERQKRFGFLLNALQYGAPPHGGFAFGLDRLAANMLGLESIRDTIPFPKTQKAYSPLTGAPGRVDEKQLKELKIKVDISEDKE